MEIPCPHGVGIPHPCLKAKAETNNPAFELAYWRYGLDVACKWQNRLGLPGMAVDALLMETSKNAYNTCGIKEGGPAGIYFPGNGGLLYAVALMAAGIFNMKGSRKPSKRLDGESS